MLASIFSLNVIQTALELGCIYALVALALFISYSTLNIADLSTDGCFILGCAVACRVAQTGHPLLALPAAMAAGVLSGFVTAFLQTRLGVESIMAGIIVNTGLYTVNLAVMGFASYLSLLKADPLGTLVRAGHCGGVHRRGLRAGGAVFGHAAGPFDPRHRRQRRNGARFLHQPGLYHHGGPVRFGQSDGPFGRAAGPVPEKR